MNRVRDHRNLHIEVAAFVGLAILSKLAVDPLIWRFSGPITLILTLIVLTFYLRRRNLSWSSFGLIKLTTAKSRWLLIPQTLITILAILGTGLTVGLAGEASGVAFMAADPEPVNARWGNLAGNLPLYLLWLTLAWVCSGFAEEMFFRGYLVTRLRAAFGSTALASIPAVVLPAIVFGFGHVYYQGIRGLVLTGAIGVAMGTLFLVYKRNLWPLVLAHGSVSTLSFTALYMDLDI